MYWVLINIINKCEGSLLYYWVMNEINLKIINCMIKNFYINKVEKI